MGSQPQHRLNKDNIRINDELIIIDDHVNAAIETWFDVDERLGTATYGTADYINLYADYYPEHDRLDAYYTIHYRDGSDGRNTPVALLDGEAECVKKLMEKAGLSDCIKELQHYGLEMTI